MIVMQYTSNVVFTLQRASTSTSFVSYVSIPIASAHTATTCIRTASAVASQCSNCAMIPLECHNDSQQQLHCVLLTLMCCCIQELGSTTLNIGIVHGGHAANALAEDAYAVLMFRLTTAPDDILATIHSVLQGTDITIEVC
jgi:Peptidase dimerisation domain